MHDRGVRRHGQVRGKARFGLERHAVQWRQGRAYEAYAYSSHECMGGVAYDPILSL